jgi:peptidoglycan/LPS O-acetylase OafA/YrhL
VLAFHYTAHFPATFYRTSVMPFTFRYGGYGVDLFFMVSGFCIFMTMERSATWQNFLGRRIARLQPAYVVAVIVTWLVVSASDLPLARPGILAAAGNLVWLEASARVPMVDGAYWSLIVELKFYFWIGALFYVSRGRGISLKWAIFTLAGVLLDKAGGSCSSVAQSVLLSPYAPSFLVGLLAWEWPNLPNIERLPLAGAAIGLLILCDRFTGAQVLGPLIALFAFVVLRWTSLRMPREIAYVGLISYSLYLLHQNIGYVVIRALAPLPIETRLAVTVALLLAAASLSYHFVERRFEKAVLRWSEATLGRCRHALRIPYRDIPAAAVDREIRAW